VVINAAPVDAAQAPLAASADYLVVNEVEADALVANLAHDRLAQARGLLALGPMVAIITLGDDGCIVAKASSVDHLPALPTRAVDTVGAGDAFCAAFAVAVSEGASLRDAARFANAAGALAVTLPGAAVEARVAAV
jgi:ribokinase